MRPTCLFCVTKHITQAGVLITEVLKGYPSHLWLATGHLAEAEDESLAEYPILAGNIRRVRVALSGQEGKFERDSVMELLSQVRKIAEKINGTPDNIRNRNIVLGIEELKTDAPEEKNNTLKKGVPVRVKSTRCSEWSSALFISGDQLSDDIEVVIGKEINNFNKKKPYTTNWYSFYELV